MSVPVDSTGPAVVRRLHLDAFLSGWTSDGEPRSWHLPQDRDVATIGRAPDVDIHVDKDSQVSRVHARMERVSGLWSIVDDGLSRNGTMVNSQRVTSRVRLADRDRITVGHTLLVFCAPDQTGSDLTVVADAVPLPHNLTEAQLGVLRALCRPCLDGGPYTAPATNQEIAAERSLSLDWRQDPPAHAVRQVRHRRPAAEPEARQTRGARDPLGSGGQVSDRPVDFVSGCSS